MFPRCQVGVICPLGDKHYSQERTQPGDYVPRCSRRVCPSPLSKSLSQLVCPGLRTSNVYYPNCLPKFCKGLDLESTSPCAHPAQWGHVASAVGLPQTVVGKTTCTSDQDVCVPCPRFFDFNALFSPIIWIFVQWSTTEAYAISLDLDVLVLASD